jgi:hypothetical protein
MAGQVTSPQAQSLVDVSQPDILGGIKTGADLAQRRVQNEFKQQELDIRKGEAKLQRDQFNQNVLQNSISLMGKMQGRSPKAKQAMAKILARNFQRLGGGLGETALADLLEKDETVLKQLTAMGGDIQKAMASGAIDPATASDLGRRLATIASKDGGTDFAPMIKQFQDQLTGAVKQARDIQKIQVKEEEARVSTALQQDFESAEAEKERRFKASLAEEKLTEDARQFNEKLEFERKKEALEAHQKSMDQEFETTKLNQKLRDELAKSPEFQAYSLVRNDASRAISALNSPSPFGDMSVYFKLVKTLDPDSVVRESELGQIKISGDIGTRVANLLNNLATGTRIAKQEARQDLVNLFRAEWQQRQKSYLERRVPTMREAVKLGLINTDPGSEMVKEDVAAFKKVGKKQPPAGQQPGKEKAEKVKMSKEKQQRGAAFLKRERIRLINADRDPNVDRAELKRRQAKLARAEAQFVAAGGKLEAIELQMAGPKSVSRSPSQQVFIK